MAVSVRVENGSGRPRVFLAGEIDERAGVAKLLSTINGPAVLNLSGIKHVNSMGLLQWLSGIKQLTERTQVDVEAISYMLAVQAGHVADLFGRAKVVSCMSPYFCPKCSSSREVELRASEVLADGQAPQKKCPVCQTSMEFDEMDTFLIFMTEPA